MKLLLGLELTEEDNESEPKDEEEAHTITRQQFERAPVSFSKTMNQEVYFRYGEARE